MDWMPGLEPARKLFDKEEQARRKMPQPVGCGFRYDDILKILLSGSNKDIFAFLLFNS